LKVDKLWENIFKYSEYEKGGEYSASDIIGDVLQVRLRKDNPNHDAVDYQYKISAFIGSAIHKHIEDWLEAENAFEDTKMQSEVKLKFRNISGTADIIIDGNIILDWKSGKEQTIRKQILEVENKKPSKWQQQLSIYSYLNHKQNKVEYGEYGYIAWLCVANIKDEDKDKAKANEFNTQKHGVLKVPLLPKEETIALIREFLSEIEKPIDKMEQCDGCIYWKYKWCGVRDVCPKFGKDEAWEDKVEEW